jgi:hypothetical protein
MYPVDAQTHRLVAKEHVARLREDARPAPKSAQLAVVERTTPQPKPAPSRATA